LIYGLAMWVVGTVVVRLQGQLLLHPGNWRGTLILFAVSFGLTGLLVRALCGRLPREQRLGGAISLVLPTLVLDSFSSAFFPQVFPNIAPEAGGLFGGWMLCCCGGALSASIFLQRRWRSQ